ncbi:MAG: hypothetical protein J0G98_08370 [Terrimonas ferruginea]|uniref:hypothetical protein n=1 Tax=Terrimonas ferruginea TaxID=249 RepID=UPI00092B2CF4|nr:hypothetical protein [Terrimonas ferruginea]MBN8783064.1 hypothetical protein [Terrimonas ferruginea]OJW44241.1 MAG: hypothetical protein BGO56_20375 [Sphingobacteriales bacterium 48-107]
MNQDTIKTEGSVKTFEVIIRLVNLDKERSVFFNQRDFDYEPRANTWILLVLCMRDMEPLNYLIPTTVFAAPNDVFISNEQPSIPAFIHLGNKSVYQSHSEAEPLCAGSANWSGSALKKWR